MRVLLAEDDELLGSGLKTGLQQQGFWVDWVRDGVAAERELLTGSYQACVLDLGLPRQDGMQCLAAVRRQKIATPVLILTARDGVPDRVAGLDAGADDYLVKPADLMELAQVRGYRKQVKNCPYESQSSRSTMKGILKQLEEMNPEARYSLWGSMTNVQEELLPAIINH